MRELPRVVSHSAPRCPHRPRCPGPNRHVVPVFNEQNALESSVRRLHDFLKMALARARARALA
ncbi:MAG: hypothetical protein ABI323_14510 [Solirubrobacteraceae bacterium]